MSGLRVRVVQLPATSTLLDEWHREHGQGSIRDYDAARERATDRNRSQQRLDRAVALDKK